MNDLNDLELAMAEERLMATDTRTAEEIAGSINRIKEEVREAVLEGSIRIGQELKAAKSKVPYGEWGEWLETNVAYSVRTAQNLMRIADEYGRRRTDAMEGLSITQAVLLLGLPADEREAYVESHDMDAITTDELKGEIRRLQEELSGKQETIESLMAQAETQANAEAEQRVAELEQRLAEAEERTVAAEAKAKAAEASAMGAGEKEKEEAKKAHDLMRKAQQEAAELKTKLAAAEQNLKQTRLQKERTEELLTEERSKPAKVLYETPPEVEKELAQLRASAGRSEDAAKLKAMYDVIKDGFIKLTEELKLVSGRDPELAGKMKAGFAGAMQKMAEVLGE